MMPLSILPVEGLPEVRPGDDLAALVAEAATLRDGDVVVVAQKVVSKAEGAVVDVPPGEDPLVYRARLARELAVRVLVEAPWTTIVETPQGLVCAAAGIDASNVEAGRLTLLPKDPDVSARRLRADLIRRTGANVAVVVTDTFGRPWRLGQTDVAIGLAGLTAIRDERGRPDRLGRRLEVTEVAVADEVAAAADLARTKAGGVPVVLVRGLAWKPDEHAAAVHLQRAVATDLFPRGRGALADALGGARLAERPGEPTEDDWNRALAAAEHVGERLVEIERVEGGVKLRSDDGYALGAAVATLRAALADLGWTAVVHRDGADARVVKLG